MNPELTTLDVYIISDEQSMAACAALQQLGDAAHADRFMLRADHDK